MAATLARQPAPTSFTVRLSFAVRQLRFWLTNYRRTWRGTIYSSVLNPVLYLGAMGLGLGTLVDAHGTARLGGISYLVYLAPGLMASEAMQTAMGESGWPVLRIR
jgi:lipooligosaccharide transport system permease protein